MSGPLGQVNWGAVRSSINSAREVFGPFGRQTIYTDQVVRLLKRRQVITQLADLPPKFAAMLSPLAFGRLRTLSLSQHIPSLARPLVLLHEAGHLYQETAELGVTYSNDDWTQVGEQGADLFASLALVPTHTVDAIRREARSMAGARRDLAGLLMAWGNGLWPEERALLVARNRLLARDEMGV